MAKQKIGDRTVTVKVILENLLGPQKAKDVLAKIQAEYENPKGAKGANFKDFAVRTINEGTGNRVVSGKETTVAAVTVEGVFAGGSLRDDSVI